MPDYDAGFKIVAHIAGRALAQLGDVSRDSWEPIGGEVQATERLADRAFRASRGGERFLVYMEAYIRWQAAAPWSMLAKSGLLSERERLPTVSLVYVLLPRGYRAQGGHFRLEVTTGPTQQIWFREICLWRQEPQPWWEDAPGLMALTPLCRHPGGRQAEVVQHAAGVIRGRVADRSVQADLLTTLGIFGRLAYPELDVLGVIGREHMKESKFYQEILQEGRVEAQRAAIQEVLEVRFGAEAAAALAEALRRISDSQELSALHRLAVRCRGLSAFRRALGS